MQDFFAQNILDYETSRDLLLYLDARGFAWHMVPEKKEIVFTDSSSKPAFILKCPPVFPVMTEEIRSGSFLESLKHAVEVPNYLMVLMEAGQAALAYFEAGKIDSHKVIRKYMVRAKQGKVQLSHLKTKGKSKLGSRIRLAQSKEFFEEINEKLQEWEVEHVDFIFYNASILLWNGLFEASTLPPFDKRDHRLRKIPKDLPTPTYELLLTLNPWVLQGELFIYNPEFEHILDEMEE